MWSPSHAWRDGPGFGMVASRDVRTLRLGWGPWPILPQLSGRGLPVGRLCCTKLAEWRSPNTICAWLLVRCPYCHALGQRDVVEDDWKPRNKETSGLDVSRSQKAEINEGTREEMGERCCGVEVGVPPRTLHPSSVAASEAAHTPELLPSPEGGPR